MHWNAGFDEYLDTSFSTNQLCAPDSRRATVTTVHVRSIAQVQDGATNCGNDRGSVRDFDTRMTEIPYNSWLTRFVCLFAIHIILGWTNHDSFITAFFNQKVLQICWCNFQTCTTHETSSFGFHFNSVSKEGCQISMHLVRWHTGSLRAGLPHFLLMLEETYWRVIWVDRWGALNNGRRESYKHFLSSWTRIHPPVAHPSCYCLFTSQSYNPSNELVRFCPTNEWTLHFLLNNTTCSTSTWHFERLSCIRVAEGDAGFQGMKSRDPPALRRIFPMRWWPSWFKKPPQTNTWNSRSLFIHLYLNLFL